MRDQMLKGEKGTDKILIASATILLYIIER